LVNVFDCQIPRPAPQLLFSREIFFPPPLSGGPSFTRFPTSDPADFGASCFTFAVGPEFALRCTFFKLCKGTFTFSCRFHQPGDSISSCDDQRSSGLVGFFLHTFPPTPPIRSHRAFVRVPTDFFCFTPTAPKPSVLVWLSTPPLFSLCIKFF